ncbi:MAG: LptF/LptG family permease [Sulfuricurvum sp.]
MNRLQRYLISNLSSLFFSIYLPLFTIASMIFLIKVSTYTAIIQLNFSEMGLLYLFTLPELFFYTLPVAFIVSTVLTLYRLSNDNELVVVFSLGLSPTHIAKIFSVPAFVLSLLLLIDFLIITPFINVTSANFLEKKKVEAKFNLAASEFGHNFGDWMLFINNSDDEKNVFKDVVLFNKAEKNEIFISAKKAEIINQNGITRLKLDNGKTYSYNEGTFKEMIFQTAYINNSITKKIKTYRSTLDYWTGEDRHDKKVRAFITNILLSLFPILSIWLILALGIVHARHQNRWIYLWLFVAVVAYYVLSVVLQQWIGFHAIWMVGISWVVLTYMLYYRLVGKRY